MAFTVRADTRFRRGDLPARREEVHAGERVVVHGKTSGDHVEATEVRLAQAKK